MTIVEYINNRIKEIDNKLINIIDYDEIMRLRQQKTAYLIYLELYQYHQKNKKK